MRVLLALIIIITILLFLCPGVFDIVGNLVIKRFNKLFNIKKDEKEN